MEYREKIKKYGFIVLENIFTKEKLINCKDKIIDYVNKNNCIKNCEGLTVPDFIKIPQLIDTANLKNNFKLNKILEDIFSKNYRFCQHNDINNMDKSMKDIFYLLSTDKLIKVFSEITGIKELEYDPYLHGS